MRGEGEIEFSVLLQRMVPKLKESITEQLLKKSDAMT